MVQDAILPTEPVRAGEDDAIERLRDQYYRERQGRIPASFKNPVLWNGVAVEVPSADRNAGGELRWRDAASGATVSGGRAEIAWSGGRPPAQGRYVLCQGDHRVIAEISVDAEGMAIKAVEKARCWYWVAVEPKADDLTGFNASQPARFIWRLAQGGALPDTSRRDDRWLNGRTQRLDLPLDLRDGAKAQILPVVLVDRVTGWAIGSQIGQAPAPNSAH